MTSADLEFIERTLGFPLPEDYRLLMLSHPMEGLPGEDLMLHNSTAPVVDPFGRELETAEVTKPFIIGSDGGEEVYFMDAGRTRSPVFVYDFELGTSRVLCADLAAFIEHIEKLDAEVAADDERLRLRHLNRKWWEFWK